MPPKNKTDAVKSSQSKISFNPSRSRRSAASEEALAAKAAHKAKQGLYIDQPRLRQRKEKEIQKELDKPETLSQQNIDDVINGEESQKLLAEFSKDRFQFPRFHQEELSVGEKLLKFFDLAIKYGPAQGLTRLERWQRAHRLGKQPPQHVLRVLEAAQHTDRYADRYEWSLFGELH